jgi:hypothetical protein
MWDRMTGKNMLGRVLDWVENKPVAGSLLQDMFVGRRQGMLEGTWMQDVFDK